MLSTSQLVSICSGGNEQCSIYGSGGYKRGKGVGKHKIVLNLACTITYYISMYISISYKYEQKT